MPKAITEDSKVNTTVKTLWAFGVIIFAVAVWVTTINATTRDNSASIAQVKQDLNESNQDRTERRDKNYDMLLKLDRRLSRIEGKLGIPELHE